jgi:alpha-beta hydrolase superfamily lysophospholipase
MFIARTFSRIWPTMPAHLGKHPERNSRDPLVVEAEGSDGRLSDLATARLGTEITETIAYVNAHAGDVRLPVLILHGGADRVNEVAGAQRFYEAIPYPDKTIKIYPGAYHRLHYDLNKGEVIEDMLSWMNQRIKG